MQETAKKIILATNSPYRKRAFETLGIDFEVCESNVDEKFNNRPKDPAKLVLELAKRKCEAVAEKYKKGIVIGFDSVGCCGNKILEKPKNVQEAKKRILMMSGKKFVFYTGVYIKDVESGKDIKKVIETEGKMRKVSAKEIDFYHKQDKKGIGYAIGFDVKYNFSSTFIEGIKGSYSNFLDGIPLREIIEMLYKVGFKLPPKPKIKIAICASIDFAYEIKDSAQILEKMGYEIDIPMTAQKILNGELAMEKFKSEKEKNGDGAFRKIQYDVIKKYYGIIKNSDAILVLNFNKKGIKNYIGGNTFLEMGFAHVSDKKIYLLNPVPELGYKDEIIAMQPIILNGNLKNIK